MNIPIVEYFLIALNILRDYFKQHSFGNYQISFSKIIEEFMEIIEYCESSTYIQGQFHNNISRKILKNSNLVFKIYTFTSSYEISILHVTKAHSTSRVAKVRRLPFVSESPRFARRTNNDVTRLQEIAYRPGGRPTKNGHTLDMD